ncbi:unnamed protein product [Penicillium salamii]|nr:unnamed protein product [Penicillium salamii]
MAGLKKFFQDRNLRPATSLGLENYNVEDANCGMAVDSPARSQFEGFPKNAQSLDVAHHFEQIDKQFEDLQDRLDRPTSFEPLSSPTTRFAVPRVLNGRHVDLLDALGSSDRPRTTSPEPFSPPLTPYNEDVAERNMTRFLRIQYKKGFSPSRVLSALYQEDVADRNISKYSSAGRTMSGLSSQSSPAAPGRVRIPEGQTRQFGRHFAKKPNWASAENLRNPPKEDATVSPRANSDLGTSLRPQRSAPSLCADEGFVPQEAAPPSPVQRLGVPPAHKLGKRWSNTPLPDSPTIPITPTGDNSGAAEAPTVLPRPFSSVSRNSPTPRSRSPQPSGPVSKKNARGLSINTQLAAKGTPKIVHRAIQPPTPSTGNMKRPPSIAQVMSSPLPIPSPVSPPKSSTRVKAAELMNLFTKTYTSAHGTHPTYESLHDAIVREVNSHEAFKRVPPPIPGPPFTPSAEQMALANASVQTMGLNRSASTASRMNKSFKHKRSPESRRSISTGVGDKFKRKVSSPRRRHTDAPPPSAAFLSELQPKQSAAASLAAGEPITYMDVLRASSEQPTLPDPDVPRRGRSDSIPNFTATLQSFPDVPLPKTIYCMQAHSTPPSSYEEDDDIIHLPSLDEPTPRVQIEGVDENNIRYVIDAASEDEAQKLMCWPRRIRGGVGSNAFENSLSPLSRARMQLRGSRSVETC